MTLFDSSGFPARWHCGTWSELLGWTTIISDLLIWAAYMSIPLMLLYLVIKKKDIPFPPVFYLFGAFIVLCGFTHLTEAYIFWNPVYRLSAFIKFLTAMVSLATAATLLPILPEALKLRSPKHLFKELDDLKKEREKVYESNKEISAENIDLRRFQDLSVDRELKMLELKKEINKLLAELKEAPRYKIEE